MTTPTRYEALMQVFAVFGTQQAMADALGVSQPSVWRWLNQSKQLPAEGGLVILAERLTGVSRHHLRPDIYPVEECTPVHRFHGVDRRAQRVCGNRGQLLDGQRGAA